MQESKRQLQVGRLIEEELNFIFQKEGLSMMHGGMVSISKVGVTPDLLEARVYLSLFQIEDKESILRIFEDKTPEIRGALGNRLRHQLRRIPVLSFIIDDTLDYVFKMENLLKEIKEKTDTDNPADHNPED